MDDGNGERIGSIIGLRNGLQTEVKPDHFLHLFFMGVTIAGDGHFDLVWRIFKNRELILFSDEQADATSFGDRDAGGDVLFEEEFLDCHHGRVILVDNLVERVINILESVGLGGVGWCGNDTIVNCLATFDDAKAADASAGVDAEDSIHSRTRLAWF